MFQQHESIESLCCWNGSPKRQKNLDLPSSLSESAAGDPIPDSGDNMEPEGEDCACAARRAAVRWMSIMWLGVEGVHGVVATEVPLSESKLVSNRLLTLSIDVLPLDKMSVIRNDGRVAGFVGRQLWALFEFIEILIGVEKSTLSLLLLKHWPHFESVHISLVCECERSVLGITGSVRPLALTSPWRRSWILMSTWSGVATQSVTSDSTSTWSSPSLYTSDSSETFVEFILVFRCIMVCFFHLNFFLSNNTVFQKSNSKSQMISVTDVSRSTNNLRITHDRLIVWLYILQETKHLTSCWQNEPSKV